MIGGERNRDWSGHVRHQMRIFPRLLLLPRVGVEGRYMLDWIHKLMGQRLRY